MEYPTAPVPSRIWWRDHFHDVIGGEAVSALGEELGDRAGEAWRRHFPRRLRTLDELAHLWCGRIPEAAAHDGRREN